MNIDKVRLKEIKEDRANELEDEARPRHPIQELSEEDLEFVLRFVLASGSLKEMCGIYSVSYPTLRARLDRLIDRLHRLMERRAPDPVSDLLADLIERGELSVAAARSLRDLVRSRYRRREEPPL